MNKKQISEKYIIYEMSKAEDYTLPQGDYDGDIQICRFNDDESAKKSLKVLLDDGFCAEIYKKEFIKIIF